MLVRVTVGVEAHTHEFIATAHEDQKFGLALADGAAASAAKAVAEDPHLNLIGLHSHIGSQIFDAAGFEVAAHRMAGLVADLVTDGHRIEEPEPRRWNGHRLHPDDDPRVQDMAKQLQSIVTASVNWPGSRRRLAVEPGGPLSAVPGSPSTRWAR